MAIVLIFDVGATNIRTIAINEKGEILSSHHKPNKTKLCPDNSNYHFWDIEQIWYKLQHCAEKTLLKIREQGIPLSDVLGISVTSFGVDGAPFDANGNQLYPIISWKCPRTVPIMENIANYLDPISLYQRNGIGLYSFNTLFKLIWLKENQPEIYRKMDKWVFISSMLTERLTGKFTTDRTMAGTSMMTNLNNGNWDQEVLTLLNLTPNHFPPIKKAGEKIGDLLPALAKKLGLEEIPVFSCGHDTQFAVFGSGAKFNQVVLSSGTWEILMARTAQASPNKQFIHHGLTTEFDAQSSYFNPAVQWVGSGIIEWVGKLFFTDVFGSNNYYQQMIKEGSAVPAGSNDIRFVGNFATESHASKFGKILHLSMYKTRGEIYRAALEYMALQLKNGLNVLEQVSHFKTENLICVGGGSKNQLWNQIRADVLNLPVDIVNVAESTVLGAAMFTFTGLGIYQTPEQAQQNMAPKRQRISPSTNATFYQQWLIQGEN